MDIERIDSLITAFIRPAEGANAGLIHSPNGIIMVDTTSSPADARSLLDAVGVNPEEVQMVINTHSHSDHTWGNQIFACPKLAHRLCLERMQTNLKEEWSEEEIRGYLTDLQRRDAQKAADLRMKLKDLHITLPEKVFETCFKAELGGVIYEVIHLGGHTPDLSVVWLSESGVLFASDLIFQGRYPYIFDADIPVWINRLGALMEYNAAYIIPGHGVLCAEAEISTLRDYLQNTWERTAEHIHLGHSADETAVDPAFLRFPGEQYERLHQANIRYMYDRITDRLASSGVSG